MFVTRLNVRGFRAAAEQTVACDFPGRFSLLVGPNGVGKTTICDALYLAHKERFPQLPAPSAAVLGVATPREISVSYAFEADETAEGPLGRMLRSQVAPAPAWTRSLERSLGRVRVS